MAAYPVSVDPRIKSNVNSSGVSWAAVLGGSVVAAALSLILLALGAGLGLSSVSPWSNAGASPATIGKIGIGWLILTQAVASAMGGYLAGRLRTKWVAIHTDEVYFRDTAHGFLVWAVGVVITASLLTSAALTMAGSPAASESGSSQVGSVDNDGYLVDSLFRSSRAASENDMPTRAEAERILIHDLGQTQVSDPDKGYLAELVVARTGLNQGDAEKRVNDVMVNARQAADDARKAAAHLLLWTFLAFLIGAFCASYAATIGGKQRDRVKEAVI